MLMRRHRPAHVELLRVSILILSVISLVAAVAAATTGEAFAFTASRGAYGPPPVTTPPPPGAFTAVVTAVSVGPVGAIIGPVEVDGADITVVIPAGAFHDVIEVIITQPVLAAITPPPGSVIVAGVGVRATLNGSPYPGRFPEPISVTFRAPRITASSVVTAWNGRSFVSDPNATTTAGAATVTLDTDPAYAIAAPVTSPVKPETAIPGATTPVTGKPFLGEGILAGALVLAGAGGIAASRRRRAGRVLLAARLVIRSVTATQEDGQCAGRERG
jgi:hypothetical protein